MDPTLIIATIAVFIVSIIFSMFGQGGGSLYTPILFLIGYTALISISTSLVLNLITALSAAIVYYRADLIDLRLATAFIPGICIGAFAGGVMTNFVNPEILLWLFVVFLAIAGARMIIRGGKRSRPGKSARSSSHGEYTQESSSSVSRSVSSPDCWVSEEGSSSFRS